MGDASEKQWQWVYVIAHERDGKPVAPIKVGISARPMDRLAGLKTAASAPLIGVFGLKFGKRELSREVEQTFHRYCAAFQTNGEWFDIEPIAAVHMLLVIVQARAEYNGMSAEQVASILRNCGATDYAEGVVRRLRGWNFKP